MSGPDHSGLATTPLLLDELLFVSTMVVLLLSILLDDWIVLICEKQLGPHGGLIDIPSITACTTYNSVSLIYNVNTPY